MTAPQSAWRRVPRGITFRISVLSWLITLSTLAIFVMAIIPEQKRDLQNALDSKARGIASSLQDVTAGAAVSADYSSVVDQALQVIAGDGAIDYLVVTKNDGFSIIIDRNGWRTETLDSFWRPALRDPSAGIRVAPLFNRRVFHAAKPFDYSGIPWGWMSVGLSLKDYDRSVARVYQRTGLLAVVCVGISLFASVWYARRLVRPIVGLQTVVGQVAQGDLSARAKVRTGDEVEGLANSFNAMADSILQRNRILESVRFGAQEFLSAGDWRTTIPEVLERIGRASRATQAYVFEGSLSPCGALVGDCLYTWALPEGDGAARPGARWNGATFAVWGERLRAGEVVCLRTHIPAGLTGPAWPGVQSSILIPVHVEGKFFGFLGFEDHACVRDWSEAEQDCFRAVAGMLGAAITRQRAQDALVEAKETLEARVLERTRELQQQVDAKERAHAALAEAQQRLIELSRLSGMAEVATGVLHNVGNVLNSVNVSATIVADRVRESRVDNLLSVIDMLGQHADDLPDFLRYDPKGVRILPYLGNLGRHFHEERQLFLTELGLLTDHIGHIKQIVSTQQNYAKVSGLIEAISLPGLVEDALRIIQPGFDRAEIRLERDFEDLPPVTTDKHLVLQILLNLLRNAKQAINDSGKPENVIGVRVRRHSEDRVRVSVTDTGVGLPPENLTRIFAHGFTTKLHGHGFGLHSGALAARQMGGSLWAESEGPSLGATFTLELPLTAPSEIRKGRVA